MEYTSKKLLWFYPHLMRLNDNKCLETTWHNAWFKLARKQICLVDRTGLSKKYGDGLDIQYIGDKIFDYDIDGFNYNNGEYWHKNFPNLMNKISDRLLDRAENYNEIRLSYSGGTDSATALVALLNNNRITKWLKAGKFVLYTTTFAKIEDPLLWSKILELNIPLKLINYDVLDTDVQDFIMVTGDGDAYGTWWQMLTHTRIEGGVSFSNDEIFNYPLPQIFPKLEQWFIERNQDGVCFDYFRDLIRLSDMPVENLHQAWNWLENCIATQCYMFRPTAYGSGGVKITPRDNWFWFMADRDLIDVVEYESLNKLYTDDRYIKYQCLKYIAEYLELPDIAPKNKLYSQIKIPKTIVKKQIFVDYTHTEGTKLCPTV